MGSLWPESGPGQHQQGENGSSLVSGAGAVRRDAPAPSPHRLACFP